MMRIKTTVLSICMALLIPISVAAKKPEVCNLEVVYTDLAFEVRVRPSSGQWFQPTVSVEMALPLMDYTAPDTYSQVVTQTFDSTRDSALALFTLPADESYITIDLTGTFNVFATVSEPVNRGKSLESYCETTISLVE